MTDAGSPRRPRTLRDWFLFARDVLELPDGEARAYASARSVEDANRDALRRRAAADAPRPSRNGTDEHSSPSS
jgi:hypothetical protein